MNARGWIVAAESTLDEFRRWQMQCAIDEYTDPDDAQQMLEELATRIRNGVALVRERWAPTSGNV